MEIFYDGVFSVILDNLDVRPLCLVNETLLKCNFNSYQLHSLLKRV